MCLILLKTDLISTNKKIKTHKFGFIFYYDKSYFKLIFILFAIDHNSMNYKTITNIIQNEKIYMPFIINPKRLNYGSDKNSGNTIWRKGQY